MPSLPNPYSICDLNQVLRANGNRITEVSSLKSSLPNLTELYLRDNSIRDIAPLIAACPSLESLDIRNNAMGLIDVVLQLAKCETLQDLWVQGNPFCQSDTYGCIIKQLNLSKLLIDLM